MLPDSRTDQARQSSGVKFFPAMMLVNPKSGGEASQLRLYQSGRLAKQFLYVSSDFKPNF